MQPCFERYIRTYRADAITCGSSSIINGLSTNKWKTNSNRIFREPGKLPLGIFFFFRHQANDDAAELSQAPQAEKVQEENNELREQENLNSQRLRLRQQLFRQEMGSRLKSKTNRLLQQQHEPKGLELLFYYTELAELEEKGAKESRYVPWALGWIHSATNFVL